MDIEGNATAIANKFLDQWAEAHAVEPRHLVSYERLRTKFFAYTGVVSTKEADAVHEALRAGRKARGWPAPGRFEAAIEEEITNIWLSTQTPMPTLIEQAREGLQDLAKLRFAYEGLLNEIVAGDLSDPADIARFKHELEEMTLLTEWAAEEAGIKLDPKL